MAGVDEEQPQVSSVGQPRFSAGHVVLAVTVLLVALAAFVLWLRAPPDPSYKGRRLSSYLYDLRQPQPPSLADITSEESWSRTVAAMDALEALGPKSIPLIMAWMKPESMMHGRLRKLAFTRGSRLGEWLARIRWVRTSHTFVAYKAATLTSEHCAAMIPMLRADVLKNGVSAGGPAQLLETIVCTVPAKERERFIRDNGEQVHVFATRVPTNGLSPVTACMLALTFASDRPNDTYALLRRFGSSWRRSFESTDIQALDPDGSYRCILDLEFGDADQRAEATRSLAKSRALPEKAVPILTANLRSAGAKVVAASAEALAAYATDTVSALPALTNLLTHTDPAVVAAASNAIAHIEMAQSVRGNTP